MFWILLADCPSSGNRSGGQDDLNSPGKAGGKQTFLHGFVQATGTYLLDRDTIMKGDDFYPRLRIREREVKILRLLPKGNKPFSSFFNKRYFKNKLVIYLFKVSTDSKSSVSQCRKPFLCFFLQDELPE